MQPWPFFSRHGSLNKFDCEAFLRLQAYLHFEPELELVTSSFSRMKDALLTIIWTVQIMQVGEVVESALAKYAPPKVGVRYAT